MSDELPPLLFSSVLGLKVFSYIVCSTKEGSSAML